MNLCVPQERFEKRVHSFFLSLRSATFLGQKSIHWFMTQASGADDSLAFNFCVHLISLKAAMSILATPVTFNDVSTSCSRFFRFVLTSVVGNSAIKPSQSGHDFPVWQVRLWVNPVSEKQEQCGSLTVLHVSSDNVTCFFWFWIL